MATEFKLPDLGENIETGDIVNVLVKEGDVISKDQNVFEVETGKAVVELPCPVAGRIAKLHVQKGSKVKVGQSLLTIEDAASAEKAQPAAAPSGGEAKQSEPKSSEKAAAKPSENKAAEKTSEPAAEKKAVKDQPAKDQASPAVVAEPVKEAKTASIKPAGKVGMPDKSVPPAGPATRRLARELGVDLSRVRGSGAGGRITEEDIKTAVRKGSGAPAAADTPPRPSNLPDGTDDRDKYGPVRRAPMTKLRKTIADNMTRSATTIPQLTNFDDADITELERIRKGGLADYVDSSVKLTMMAFVMKAIANSLRLHPLVNASVDMESEQIIYKDYVNLGVAVDTDRGLIVMTIRDADRMSIPRLAQRLTEVAEQARTGKFGMDDIQGSTFTISNLGSVGGTYSTPIINPPNVAILLTGRSRKMPVVVEDRIEARLMMPLSLTYDHRLVDGAAAARFLNEVINYLKVPGRLLLAP